MSHQQPPAVGRECGRILGAGQVGVRDARHKTIFYCDGPIKVFDLQADPLEMKDLSTAAQGKAVAARHKVHLRDYLGRIELCEQVRSQPRPYKTYLDWYRKIKEEA